MTPDEPINPKPTTTGNKTPRKVQWLDNQSNTPSTSTTHALDEHGLDRETFRELTDALERHGTATPLRKVHYYPPSRPSSSPEEESPFDSEDEPDFSDDDTRYYASSVGSTYTLNGAASESQMPLADPHGFLPGTSIEDTERYGLPDAKNPRAVSEQRAEDLIQTHLHRSTRGSHHRRGIPFGRRSKTSAESSSPGSQSAEMDLEREGHSHSHKGGILSSLLSLYHSRPSSEYVASECTLSGDESCRSTDDENWHPRKKKSKSSEERPLYSHKLKHRLPSAFGHVSRPAAARNAGGVFGSLIASTGNLAGPAAPAPSQLQPDVKQPGYHLSRYSIDDKNEPPVFPVPPPLLRRHSTRFESANTTPEPSPDEKKSLPFYNSGSKSNLSSFFESVGAKLPGSGRRSGASTPGGSPWMFPGLSSPGMHQTHPHSHPHRKRHKRKKSTITRHVAQIIRREEFLLKLTRAMMMFGGPPHRLTALIQSAARVLDIPISLLYLPDVVLLSFDDNSTGTSHIRLIRQASALDLEKLTDAFSLYWKVIHDKLSVSDASSKLDALMSKPPLYNWWQSLLIGGMCSTAICTVSFGGSFIDALVSFPLGALLVGLQFLATRNTLYSYVFEVIVTALFSFISAALATTHKFCYSAVASSSVVLILPGFLVLTGALELMSRNIIPGSVRLCFAVVYALFLGFGFAIGSQLFETFTSSKIYGAEDFDCVLSHNPNGPWYQRTPSKLWAFLTVPMFSFFLSMRNQAPFYRKEMALLVSIACVGWLTNFFSGKKFVGQGDITAALGAFAVGIIANTYARVFSGNAFVVMITGILFQLPSGLGGGGLLSYASQQASGSAVSYISGFGIALKLISVAIGLTVGLGLSLVVTHPIQSRKQEAGVFSL